MLLLLVLACPSGRAWAPACSPARSPARSLHPVLCVTAYSLKNDMEAAPKPERPPVAVTLYLIRHGESRHNSASKTLDIGLPRPATLSLPEARAFLRPRSECCAHAHGVSARRSPGVLMMLSLQVSSCCSKITASVSKAPPR